MKECEKRTGFIAFDNIEELETWFKKIADQQQEELDDNLCVEGNSGLKFDDVKSWINYFGIENVYFEKSGFEDGLLDEFWFDLTKAAHTGNVDFSNADEISISNGFLRIWFD